jgi:tripartite-type tricarboxylate transporter receptor subunit TctC
MMQKRFEGGRDKLFEQGLRLRKRVLGAAYVERQFKNADAFSLPMQVLATKSAWGMVWSRPGLPRKVRSMPFDPLKDLAPVTLAASTPNVLVVHPSLPATTVQELIALAKARPGAINFASSGPGTPAQLAGELFNSMAGVKMVHVPYKGAAPALADLLGGQVQVMFSTMPPALPHVAAGRLRALAVASLQRSPAAPELPTLNEAALPGFEATTWHGVIVPAGTPGAVVAKLHRDIVAVLRMPDVAERLSSQGAEAIGSTPQEFASYVKTETAKWAKVVRESGAKAE